MGKSETSKPEYFFWEFLNEKSVFLMVTGKLRLSISSWLSFGSFGCRSIGPFHRHFWIYSVDLFIITCPLLTCRICHGIPGCISDICDLCQSLFLSLSVLLHLGWLDCLFQRTSLLFHWFFPPIFLFSVSWIFVSSLLFPSFCLFCVFDKN